MTVGAESASSDARISPITSGWFSVSRTSASPPAARMKSRTHSAARVTSALCAGSALTLGMRRSSESSSIQSAGGSAIAAESTDLRYVSQLLAVGQRAQLLQALVLDLPDPLAGDAECPADLV